MKLIGSFTSPYVRKARVVLAEKKIEYDFVLDPPWAPDTAVPRHNPLGKVPVLLLDDNSTLYDSRVIVEYLDTVSPNNRLIPGSGRERITVKRWEALGDGVCDAAAASFLEAKRPVDQQSAPWVERQQGKILAGLQAMADDLGEQPWCHGSAFSLADIAVGCALGYLAFRYPNINWHEQHPNLAKLYAKLIKRPSFAETIPHD
ncbi:MAG: glutathione S-transferase [Pseudomonadota bacterium]